MNRMQRARPWMVLAGYMMLLVAVIGMGFYCLTLFVIPVTEELGISRAAFSLIYTFSGIGSGILTIFLVKIVKIIRPRFLAFCGGALGSLSYVLFAQIHSVWMIYLLGVILGIATILAGAAVTQIGLIPWFHRKQGLALGLAGASSGLGTAVFSPVVSRVISVFGWRNACWFICVFILSCSLISFIFLIRDDPEKMGIAPYGAEEPELKNNTVQEQSEGMSIHEAFRSPKLYMMFAGVFIATISYQILSLHQSPMIQDKGFTLEQASYCLSVFAVSNMLNKFIAGLVQDRFGIRVMCMYCAAAVIIAMLLVLYGTHYICMLGFSALFGFWPSIVVLYGVFAGNHLFGQRESAAWISVGQFGVCTGGLIAPGFSGWLYDITKSYSLLLMILIGTVLVFMGLCFYLFSEKNRYQPAAHN